MEHMEAQLHLFDAYDAAMRENEELKRMLADSEEARSDLFRQLAAARKQVDELTKAGLTRRRKAEQALFNTPATGGEEDDMDIEKLTDEQLIRLAEHHDENRGGV